LNKAAVRDNASWVARRTLDANTTISRFIPGHGGENIKFYAILFIICYYFINT
jgi:hypothetical protein